MNRLITQKSATRLGLRQREDVFNSRGMANKPDKIAPHLRRFWKTL